MEKEDLEEERINLRNLTICKTGFSPLELYLGARKEYEVNEEVRRGVRSSSSYSFEQ